MRSRKGLAKLLSVPVLAVCGFVLAGTLAGVGLATVPSTTTTSTTTPTTTTTSTTTTTTTTTTTPTGKEGCTPGFWKKPPEVWIPTGYSPTATFASVFGVELPGYTGITLVDALNNGGGGFAALGRHAVAALLNAAHPGVDYPLSVSAVIAAVQGAVASPGTVESVKNTLAGLNETSCPLPNFG
jgi:hypothetical protein